MDEVPEAQDQVNFLPLYLSRRFVGLLLLLHEAGALVETENSGA